MSAWPPALRSASKLTLLPAVLVVQRTSVERAAQPSRVHAVFLDGVHHDDHAMAVHAYLKNM